ncbi:hypothetical protein Ddc_17595 [Ditylenchus destructor]|nr:hypothetical protein Ddc_17595 [Ditylenchus destructor]
MGTAWSKERLFSLPRYYAHDLAISYIYPMYVVLLLRTGKIPLRPASDLWKATGFTVIGSLIVFTIGAYIDYQKEKCRPVTSGINLSSSPSGESLYVVFGAKSRELSSELTMYKHGILIICGTVNLVLNFVLATDLRNQQVFTSIDKSVATMSTTSLELIAQQTEVVQMYINSVFRFYDLQKKSSTVSVVPIRSSEESGIAAALTTTTISPTTNAISAGLFVAVLALHFLQILQWILSVITLALSLFVFDNLAKDDNSPITHNTDNPPESDVSRLETNPVVRRSPSPTRAQPNSNGTNKNCFSFENRVFDENSVAEENGIEVRKANENL